MVEAALPFVAFTIAWVAGRQLYPALGAALGIAVILGVIRLIQHQSLKYVAQRDRSHRHRSASWPPGPVGPRTSSYPASCTTAPSPCCRCSPW